MRNKYLFLGTVYAIFIIYGSLVPLDYRSIPFEQALESFKHIRYLDLGPESRADWIANIILYIPLSFLLGASLITENGRFKYLFATLITLFGLTLAFSIEFTQQFFPPRTVSINDLIAETIGTLIGLTLWLNFGTQWQNLSQHIHIGGRQALIASGVFYGVAYLFVGFFPFDFVTSATELKTKWQEGHDALFISESCGEFFACSAKLTAELVMALPLGALAVLLLKWHPYQKALILIFGFIFSALIEAIQILLLNGIAQGVSVLLRTSGIILGSQIVSHLQKTHVNLNIPKLIDTAAGLIPYATIPYVLLLFPLNGWILSKLQFTTAIGEQLAKVNWLPFYYHYFTTEAVAFTSLLSISLMYLPIGAGCWLWDHRFEQNSHKPLRAAVIGLALCFILESSKLFLLNKHPDPTNLIISFAVIYLTYALIDRFYGWFLSPSAIEPLEPPVSQPVTKSTQPLLHLSQSSPLGLTAALLIIGFIGFKTVTFPVYGALLLVFFLIYLALAQWQPFVWVIAIPACLPVFNLAPWSGRFFFTEFDYLLLLSVAITLWQGQWTFSKNRIKRPLMGLLFIIYLILYSISLLKGFFTLPASPGTEFANYLSAYNALRVGKGLFWSLIFIMPLLHARQHCQHFDRFWVGGLMLGLFWVCLLAIWERYRFVGILDFAQDFRISSTFFSMHTGGAHLDAYLLLVMPLILTFYRKFNTQPIAAVLAIGLFILAVYTLLMTYSRGAYIGLAFSLIVLVLFHIRHPQRFFQLSNYKIVVPIALIAIVLVVAVFQGGFIQHRFKQSGDEASIRMNHWSDAYHMMDSNWHTALIGMGIGTFPHIYWLNHLFDAPASYAIVNESPVFMRLNPGSPLYIEQIVNIKPESNYQIQLKVKTPETQGRVTLMLCEKAIQHSFDCQSFSAQPNSTNQWQSFQFTGHSKTLGSRNKPVKLGLTNSGESAIEITDLHLLDSQNTELLTNGNFEQGFDHWYFSADRHIPWRTENQWIQTLFEQGWIGLLLLSLLGAYWFFHLIRQAMNRHDNAFILLASFIGFLTIAFIDSPFDMPRITLLFFLLVFVHLINTHHQTATLD